MARQKWAFENSLRPCEKPPSSQMMVEFYVNHAEQQFVEKVGKQQSEIMFRVYKKVLLKEEIISHYQNSWFFLTYDISNIR